MTTSEDTLERRCNGHDMSPSLEHPITNDMVRYEQKNVQIVDGVAMMSMKTSAELTFMDIAPMLKINQLKDISF